MSDWVTGGILGLFVGVLSDILLAMLFKTWRSSTATWKAHGAATAAMGAILGLLFGGRWTTLLGDFTALLEPYVVGIAIVGLPIALFVLYQVLFDIPGRPAARRLS